KEKHHRGRDGCGLQQSQPFRETLPKRNRPLAERLSSPALASARASKSSDNRLHCHLSGVRVLRSALSNKITTGGARGRATARSTRVKLPNEQEKNDETRTQRIERQKQSEAHYSWPSCPRCDCTGSACLHEEHCLCGRQSRMGQDVSSEQQGQSRKGLI